MAMFAGSRKMKISKEYTKWG